MPGPTGQTSRGVVLILASNSLRRLPCAHNDPAKSMRRTGPFTWRTADALSTRVSFGPDSERSDKRSASARRKER
jgi:hypothetical protein